MKHKKQIGQLLIDSGKLSEEQLQNALDYKKSNDVYLGKAITNLGIMSEKELICSLSEQLAIPFMELGEYEVQHSSLGIIDEKFAKMNNIMPLFMVENELTVAISDPLNMNMIDELISEQGDYKVNFVLATETDIGDAVDLHYGATRYEVNGQQGGPGAGDVRVISRSLGEEREPVELTKLFLDEAVNMGASDIHIEPREDDLRIRYRVDGVLQQYYTSPKKGMSALISRIKILAGMDIAESRKPQDGRFSHDTGEVKVDIRASTFNTPNGEKIVLRILDEHRGRISLDQLGFEEAMLAQWNKTINNPNGIILVSGPTGSGKTTTLYSTLNILNSVEINIMTIEDPIEYMLENINQSQVNPLAGMTFASALKSMLRQDPDVILVGEMRDVETIELAIRSALTGHLVFSTIHTNDAASSFTRLTDMGLDPYLITSTVRAVLAQRLMRLLCGRCKTPVDIPPEIEDHIKDGNMPDAIYEPKGCIHCRNSGYVGRKAVFELLIPNSEIMEVVINKGQSRNIEKIAVKNGMKTLKDSALEYVLNGRSSVSEYRRII